MLYDGFCGLYDRIDSSWKFISLVVIVGKICRKAKESEDQGLPRKNATKKKVRCSRCKEFGHFAKTCQMPVVGEDGETEHQRGKQLSLGHFCFTNCTNTTVTWQFVGRGLLLKTLLGHLRRKRRPQRRRKAPRRRRR